MFINFELFFTIIKTVNYYFQPKNICLGDKSNYRYLSYIHCNDIIKFMNVLNKFFSLNMKINLT